MTSANLPTPGKPPIYYAPRQPLGIAKHAQALTRLVSLLAFNPGRFMEYGAVLQKYLNSR